MSGEQGWRAETDSYDYLLHQQKQNEVANRRPVIRRAADLVGPGIDAQAVAITDFNDILATYNGYYSGIAGTANAPTNDQGYVGFTVMDSDLGGVQTFSGLGTAGITYRRLFRRNPSDPESIFFDVWKRVDAGVVPVGAWLPFGGAAAPTDYLLCQGQGLSTTTYATLFSVIGYAFGGSGATFYLPDMRDRTVYGAGSQWSLGSSDGMGYGSRVSQHTHTISISSDGSHGHLVTTSDTGNHTHVIGPAGMGVTNNTAADGSSARIFSGENHDHGGTGSAGVHSHPGSALTSGAHSHTGTIAVGTVQMVGVGANYIMRYR